MDEAKLATMKEKAQKCKVISLDLLHHSPLANPSTMCPRDKNKVLNLMTEWFEKEDSVVNAEFDDIVNNKILHSKADVSVLPCEVVHEPEEAVLM